MNTPIYYLISQDFYSCEIMDVLNKNDVLSCIKEKNTEAIKIDMTDIDNLFEVIKKENNIYTIIYIHKHQKNFGKFKVGNIIYFDNGMISFYTKKNNGEIDEVSIFPTKIIKKEEILLHNSEVDLK
jgi:hypothetical protein